MEGVGSMIAGLVMSGISVVQQQRYKKKAEEAQKEIDAYQREAKTNPYASMDKYPQLAYRAANDAANRTLATNVNLARQYGRGLSVLGKAGDDYNRKQNVIQSDIEKYGMEVDKAIAAGERDRQVRNTEIENMDIEGLSMKYGINEYNRNQAGVQIGNAATYLGDALSTSGLFGKIFGGGSEGGAKSSVGLPPGVGNLGADAFNKPFNPFG